jgi:hypothetical protein
MTVLLDVAAQKVADRLKLYTHILMELAWGWK